MLRFPSLDSTAQDSTGQHRTVQHSTTQHSTTQHSTVQHNSIGGGLWQPPVLLYKGRGGGPPWGHPSLGPSLLGAIPPPHPLYNSTGGGQRPPPILSCCVVLCCVVLCCVVLCCTVLCCTVLCCTVLCWGGVPPIYLYIPLYTPIYPIYPL